MGPKIASSLSSSSSFSPRASDATSLSSSSSFSSSPLIIASLSLSPWSAMKRGNEAAILWRHHEHHPKRRRSYAQDHCEDEEKDRPRKCHRNHQSYCVFTRTPVASANHPPRKISPGELLHAAKEGIVDTVEGALQNPRTNPNMQDKSLYTALVWAATYGHLSVVKTLLADERVDTNIVNKFGYTALIIAAANGKAEVVKMLLADPYNRVDANIANRFGWSAMIWGATNGHARVVHALLADGKADPNQANQNNIMTPVRWAAGRGHSKVLELLLADPRTIRTRPPEDAPNNARGAYDAAVVAVRQTRNMRLLRGLVRVSMRICRMRLAAAEAVYAPGGAGFAAAAASFEAAAASQQQMHHPSNGGAVAAFADGPR